MLLIASCVARRRRENARLPTLPSVMKDSPHERSKNRTSGGARCSSPPPPDARLIECFSDVVEAVTPYQLTPGWTELWQLLPSAAARHRRWPELVELIAEDSIFDRFYDAFMLSSGSGSEAGRDAHDVAVDLVSRPWHRLELQGDDRTIQNLRATAIEVLDDTRRLGVGQTVLVPGRVMFDGPKMSKRFTRHTTFGRFCWTEIPPPYEEAPPFSGLTVFTRFPLHLLEVTDDQYFYAHKHNETQAAIDRFVSQLRVALLSRANADGALGPPARVILVQLGAPLVDPGNRHFGMPDPSGHGDAIRDPVAVCDLMERYVENWDPRVDTAARRLGQSMARSGQEVAGHIAEDMLIDAMIALESLFTMSQELGFRLGTAVAHLLGANADDRNDLYRQIKRLYGLRSKIVHGGTVPDNFDEPEKEAIRLAIRVMETLLFDRRDLLDVKEWEIPVILGEGPG